MTLTEEDAARVVGEVVERLQKQEANQLLDGIDESRRLGIEESLPEQKSKELRQVARTRRRPPNNSEMLHVVLDLLYQRLIVLPSIGMALRKTLGAEVIWRVDTEFVSVDRFPEAKLSDLLPDGVEDAMGALKKIIELIQSHNVKDGTAQ
jgi:hypothetical protein